MPIFVLSFNKTTIVMELKITAQQILKVLQWLAWIIFIGLMVEAGALIVNSVITIFINPAGVKNFWEGASYLSGLLSFNESDFATLCAVIIIVAVLKTLMFYQIVKMFEHKKLDMAQPFSTGLRNVILELSYFSFGIGLFSHCGASFLDSLATKGVATAELKNIFLGGADVWLFMAVLLFVIVQIVKRGIDIQTENDLTI